MPLRLVKLANGSCLLFMSCQMDKTKSVFEVDAQNFTIWRKQFLNFVEICLSAKIADKQRHFRLFRKGHGREISEFGKMEFVLNKHMKEAVVLINEIKSDKWLHILNRVASRLQVASVFRRVDANNIFSPEILLWIRWWTACWSFENFNFSVPISSGRQLVSFRAKCFPKCQCSKAVWAFDLSRHRSATCRRGVHSFASPFIEKQAEHFSSLWEIIRVSYIARLRDRALGVPQVCSCSENKNQRKQANTAIWHSF